VLGVYHQIVLFVESASTIISLPSHTAEPTAAGGGRVPLV
jgi:hypothetical protein